MPIQVLKPKFHIDECLDAIRECLEKGWTGMGFKTVQFEEAWKESNSAIPYTKICISLEEELSALPENDQKDLMKEYSIDEPGFNNLIHAVYDHLGLYTFFTVAAV